MGGGSFALPLSVNEAGAPSGQAASNGTEGPGRLDRALSSWDGESHKVRRGGGESIRDGGEGKKKESGIMASIAAEAECRSGSGYSERVGWGMDRWAEGVQRGEGEADGDGGGMEGFNGTCPSPGEPSTSWECFIEERVPKEKRDKTCAGCPEEKRYRWVTVGRLSKLEKDDSSTQGFDLVTSIMISCWLSSTTGSTTGSTSTDKTI